MNSLRRSVLTIPLVILSCAVLAGVYGGRVKATPGSSDDNIRASLRLLTKVYSVVEENYADAVDPERAIYHGAIQGMLRTLDPHSNFLDPKSFQLLREGQRGRYYGVGMTVAPRGGKTIVVASFTGSPAYHAGLRPGDIIAQVDDTPTDNLSTGEVAKLLKGPKGTTVRILVLREGTPTPVEFVITRAEISLPSIEHAFEIRPGIGFIRIASFSETASRELAKALRKLNHRNLRGLVLDLRGNQGGLLSEGVGVADMFLSQGQVIVSHRGRVSGEKVYRATRGNGGVMYPLVVLINRQSASASEIVAGAVQDHDRGLVVGETSFGKGLVQTVYPLRENTGLALTTARYYTPSGRLIQREFTGITLYDYYYYRDEDESDDNERPQRQIRMTDSGRPVYGGGGITPDVKILTPPLKGFLRTLVRKSALFNFAKFYLASHRTIDRDFQVDESVLEDFRRFLDREKIVYTEEDIQKHLETIQRRIKQHLFISVFGKGEGDRSAIETDQQVLKAIELLPKAKELVENARRTLAQPVVVGNGERPASGQVLLVLVDRIAPQGYLRRRCTGEAGAGTPGPQGDNATARRIAKLDEQLKHLMKGLDNAINESLSKSERIAEVIGNIKHAGYEVFLVLEATIGFNRREESIKKEPLKSVTNPSGRVRFTTQDAKFLKALQISVDEDMH